MAARYPVTVAPQPGLRAVILRGGVIFSLRQALGMIFGVVGVLITTRILGPTQYGLYVTALGVHQYSAILCQAGIGAYLVRSSTDVGENEFDVASTALLLVGCVGGIIEAFLLPVFGTWIGLSNAMPILALLAASLPLSSLSTVAISRLERRLDFGRIALVEVVSQILYYAVAIPLALTGWKAWSLASAFVVQVAVTCVLFHLSSRWLPRFSWHPSILRGMLRYAIGYSGAMWIWQARFLVNPLIVGGVLGVEAVGFINLSIKIIEVLSFIKSAAWRLSLATLGRLQSDKSKLLSAIAEGSELQVLASGSLYVLFAFGADKIIAYFFGPAWLPTLVVFPFIAIGYLTNSVFALQQAALNVYHKNMDVMLFSGVHVAVLFVSSYFLSRFFGIIGYGYAELATLPSYLIIDTCFRRHVGIPSYSTTARWYVPLTFSLLFLPLGLWVPISLFLCMIIWPTNLRRIAYYGRLLQGLR
jgi:O-antigen/teichoic acid export membrane protein